MEFKGTKGEWRRFNDRIESWGQYHDTVICRMENLGEKRANADLIAAAPELLEALRFLIDTNSITKEGKAVAERAINKALAQ